MIWWGGTIGRTKCNDLQECEDFHSNDNIDSYNDSVENIEQDRNACVDVRLSTTDRFFMEKGDVYRSLFKYNKAVTLLINPENFEIIDANNAACEYYGWPFEVITCMKIHDINVLPPEKILEEMQNAVTEKRNYFLFRHRLADGQIRDVEVYSSPVIVNSKQLLYSIVHDITERKKAEAELNKRNMQLRTAQKIGHIGSWEFNLNTGKVDSSDEAKRIYGYDPDIAILRIKDVQAVVLPEYRPMMDDVMRGLIHNGIPYEVQFKISRQNDGAIRDIHSIAEYDAEKNAIIGTIQDITERKKVEDALLQAKIVAEAANRSKDEFLATMSHELRTPLTSIIGFSDILEDGMFGELNEKQNRYVGHILDAGNHLLKLINDVLDLSKVEAGKMELELEYFSLSMAVEEVKILVTPMAMDKRIKLVIDTDTNIGQINADRTKLKQVLYNLASNAIKFTPEKGTVSIISRQSDNMLHVCVKDTGIGISEKDQARLFQPFRQLNSYITNEYAGTGLGLALVKKFVEIHNGKVWVDSTIGEGSEFCFSIPVTNSNK
ncbi:PAS domain-containing sensor histidine kinase [Methanolobus vulcani]|uniref:histidine kinase n=1 Tax=Methanolobus vulcani TaxID=38026 RepID=A0A7Z8P1Z8_9EURY|nr:PAS domain-containing sensor histidine kinase [Methanolobus vulcani]TQD24899.1 PAS domain-containing sensor histidine kinase [Methanolobus vulcani]